MSECSAVRNDPARSRTGKNRPQEPEGLPFFTVRDQPSRAGLKLSRRFRYFRKQALEPFQSFRLRVPKHLEFRLVRPGLPFVLLEKTVKFRDRLDQPLAPSLRLGVVFGLRELKVRSYRLACSCERAGKSGVGNHVALLRLLRPSGETSGDTGPGRLFSGNA